MSTASATILAPSALFANNIIKPFLDLNEKELLKLTRFVVI
jgi:Na+/proline symporter